MMNDQTSINALQATRQGMTAGIAGFVADADLADFPDSARQAARLSLLDWSAVAVAGVGEPVSRVVRGLVAMEAGTADASVFGLAGRFPARAAALANGATSHALDYDDTHFEFVGHPSAPVASAVLALAQRQQASGAQLLQAFLVGVETACRVGRWLGMDHYQHGFHQTATAGAIGAAAGCARLMALGEQQTRHALGLVATRASGLKSQFGTMGKPYHAGMAAANGVEAVLLASLGFESRIDGIECEQGFGPTHAGQGGDCAPYLQGLGRQFRFERVQYKFHACCHATHPSLEALQLIRERHQLAPAEVTAVTLRLHPRWLRVCHIEHPVTGLQAKFSLRLTAAMMLAGVDTAALSSFSDAACARPDLVALRDLVTVETDDTMADMAVVVGVTTRSRGRFEQALDLDAPVPFELRRQKLLAKASALLGEARAIALWSQINDLEHQPVAAYADLLASYTR